VCRALHENNRSLWKMKPSQFLLGHRSLSDASYWDLNMAIREQGSGRHRLSGAPYWNPDMVISERELNRHHLSDAPGCSVK
jgi:hypothetical protein